MPSTGDPKLKDSAKEPATKGPSEYVKAQIAAWVRQEYERMKNQRGFEHRKWSYHLAMLDGHQYLQSSGVGDFARLSVPKIPNYRARTVTNKLRPMVRMEISYYCSQQPTAVVVPASGEAQDTFAALAAEQVWNSTYSRLRMKQKWVRNAFWFVVTGNAFVKTTWDNDQILADVEASYDLGDGQIIKLPAQGDVSIENVTPFHLFVPDLLEPEIEDQPYVCQVYTKPVEWARTYYDDPNITADCKVASEILDSIYFNRAANQESKPDSVLVMEMWIKPGTVALCPDGGFCTVINERLYGYVDHLPYTHGQYPFAHAKTLETGKFYGASVLEDLIPLQKEYNATRNQIIDSKRRMGKPQWVVPKGSVNVNNMTAEPGLVIPYEPGLGVPQQIPGAPIPNYVIQELDRINADFEDISGQHAVSKGQSDSGVVAATAINFLQEKDDAMRSVGYSNVEDMNAKTARHALSLFVDYVDVPRAIRITGTDQAFNILELKGSDIKSGLDVQIEGGSALPQSKQAKQALLMDLFTAGAIGPEDLLSLLDIGGVQRLTDRLRVDMSEAQRENLKFKNLSDADMQQYMVEVQQQSLQGPDWQNDPNTGLAMGPASIVPVQSWQNHEIHIQEHNNYRKSTEFEILPDMIKTLLEQHIQMHQMAIGTAQMGGPAGMPVDFPGDMMQEQQQAPPEPPPPSGVAGPQGPAPQEGEAGQNAQQPPA